MFNSVTASVKLRVDIFIDYRLDAGSDPPNK